MYSAVNLWKIPLAKNTVIFFPPETWFHVIRNWEIPANRPAFLISLISKNWAEGVSELIRMRCVWDALWEKPTQPDHLDPFKFTRQHVAGKIQELDRKHSLFFFNSQFMFCVNLKKNHCIICFQGLICSYRRRLNVLLPSRTNTKHDHMRQQRESFVTFCAQGSKRIVLCITVCLVRTRWENMFSLWLAWCQKSVTLPALVSCSLCQHTQGHLEVEVLSWSLAQRAAALLSQHRCLRTESECKKKKNTRGRASVSPDVTATRSCAIDDFQVHCKLHGVIQQMCSHHCSPTTECEHVNP